jgi:hypothetical protein
MVEQELPKLTTRVRFPSSAPSPQELRPFDLIIEADSEHPERLIAFCLRSNLPLPQRATPPHRSAGSLFVLASRT